jgi:hypothetical protein
MFRIFVDLTRTGVYFPVANGGGTENIHTIADVLGSLAMAIDNHMGIKIEPISAAISPDHHS